MSGSRQTALDFIAEVNKLTSKMNELWDQYSAMYLERECLLAKLRSYKYRGIISDEEIPHTSRPNLQQQLSEYRKQRKA